MKYFKKLPNYKFISSSGPRHNPKFKIAVKLENTIFYGHRYGHNAFGPKWIRIDRSKINALNLSSQARININIELKPLNTNETQDDTNASSDSNLTTNDLLENNRKVEPYG